LRLPSPGGEGRQSPRAPLLAHLPSSHFVVLPPTDIFPLPTALSPFANMVSFLRPSAFHFSQPPSLEDDPTGGPSCTVCPSSHPNSDPYHYEPSHHYFELRPDLYPGPLNVTPAGMPSLFDILLTDVDEKVLHNEISTALGSAYLSETPHLTSPYATVDGIMFGEHFRVLFPLVVRLPGKKSRSYVIHFLYDSGSPFTFLSQEVCGVPTHFTCNHSLITLSRHAISCLEPMRFQTSFPFRSMATELTCTRRTPARILST